MKMIFILIIYLIIGILFSIIMTALKIRHVYNFYNGLKDLDSIIDEYCDCCIYYVVTWPIALIWFGIRKIFYFFLKVVFKQLDQRDIKNELKKHYYG